MTNHCEGCPFIKDCPLQEADSDFTCDYRGGAPVVAQQDSAQIGYNGGTTKATPSGASTPNAGGLALPNAPEGLMA